MSTQYRLSSDGSAKIVNRTSAAMTATRMPSPRLRRDHDHPFGTALSASTAGLPNPPARKRELTVAGEKQERCHGEHERRHVLVLRDRLDRRDQRFDEADDNRRDERQRDRSQAGD